MKLNLKSNEMTTSYVAPKKILWKSENEGCEVVNAEALLQNKEGQATLEGDNLCKLVNKGSKAGILLDFGTEMQGGIQIITHMTKGHVRVRFGESAMEAMSEIGGRGGATNDHAVRDSVYLLSWLGMTAIGNTGFRFVRIDLEDENTELTLKEIRAAFTYRDLDYKGSFECNDERINQIWETAAYTVHLNMQEYLWDGVKRDRLVWIGDMHPEVSTVAAVFGNVGVVPKSLDLIREKTKLPNVMNGIPAYTLWWILIQRDWYLYTGDKTYLQTQRDYVREAVALFSGLIDADGNNHIENNFLDWPSSVNAAGQKAGVHALLILAMRAAQDIFRYLDDSADAEFAGLCADKLTKVVYDANGLKQALAMQVLAGQKEADKVAEELTRDGVHGYSTFLGYYILKALGEAEKTDDALDAMSEYWGAMLDLGATTFWEDFDIDWTKNCSKLDELLPEDTDKDDVHGSFGGYCYKGYRHSFCHGWASGPAPFLSQYVLGFKPLAPGCKKLLIAPSLGRLTYAKGSFPTPYGTVYVEHTKTKDGDVRTVWQAPDEIEIVLG